MTDYVSPSPACFQEEPRCICFTHFLFSTLGPTPALNLPSGFIISSLPLFLFSRHIFIPCLLPQETASNSGKSVMSGGTIYLFTGTKVFSCKPKTKKAELKDKGPSTFLPELWVVTRKNYYNRSKFPNPNPLALGWGGQSRGAQGRPAAPSHEELVRRPPGWHWK